MRHKLFPTWAALEDHSKHPRNDLNLTRILLRSMVLDVHRLSILQGQNNMDILDFCKRSNFRHNFKKIQLWLNILQLLTGPRRIPPILRIRSSLGDSLCYQNRSNEWRAHESP